MRTRACLRALGLAAGAAIAGLAASAQTTAAANPSLTFNPVEVGTPTEARQTLTASFQLSSSNSLSRTDLSPPTATLHYGRSFSAGAVTCTENTGGELCTVSITFRPAFPGGRKDALFITEGSRRLATILLYGVGKAPLALVEPGTDQAIDTTPAAASSPATGAGVSVVDEAGTLYVVNPGSAISSISRTGAVTAIPLVSSATSIGIDGAGVLYLSERGAVSGITFDTVQGVEGVWKLPTLPPGYVWLSTAVGNTGAAYAVRGSDHEGSLPLWLVSADPGGATSAAVLNDLNPSNDAKAGTYALAVDSGGDIFLDGGSRLFRIAHSGARTDAGAGASARQITTDAAGALYTASGEEQEGSAATALTNRGGNGVAVGADGNLYRTSGLHRLDVLDRSQGKLDFGDQSSDVLSDPRTISIYNGGNLPLTLSAIQISGSAFSLQTSGGNNCAIGIALAPGDTCTAAVSFQSPHAGRFSGTLSLTTNSLNAMDSVQTVALTGRTSGPFVTASPNHVTFQPQAVGTTSEPLSVTLTNNGLNPAVLALPAAFESFVVSPGTCASVLPVNGSCRLSLAFSPRDAAASTTAAITFPVACSGCEAKNSVTLIGIGSIFQLLPQILFDPGSLAFGSQAVGTNTVLPITLSNPSLLPEVISSIDITGTGAGAFSEYNTCGPLLLPFASCKVYVNFKPTTAAGFSASLRVYDCGKSSPDLVPLSGTGTRPQITLAIQEVLHLSDSKVTLARPTLLAIQEAIHLSDKPALRPSVVLAVREALHVSDSPKLMVPVLLAIQEKLHLTDSTPKLVPSVVLAVREAIHVSDAAPKLVPSVVLAVKEALHVADNPKVMVPIVLAVKEALHLSDATLKLTPSRILVVKEAIHVSDAVQVKLSIPLRIAEAIHVSDKPVLKVPVLLAITEALHLSDKPALKPSVLLAVKEALHLADKPSLKPSTALIVKETLHLSDGTPKLTRAVKLAITEVIHTSDRLTTLKPSITLTIQEALHLKDAAPALQPSRVLAVLESIHLSDAVSRIAPSTVLAINETLHMADTTSAAVPYVLAIAESIHLSDGASQIAPSTVLAINETLHLADASSAAVPYVLAVAESIHLSDSASQIAPSTVLAINEALHIADTPSVTVPYVLSILEPIHVTDSLSQIAPSTVLSISETLHLIDTPTITAPYVLSVAESIHLSDGAQIAPSTVLAIREALHITDTPSVMAPYLLSIAESIHLSDGASRIAPSTVLAINEAVHMTDAAPSIVAPYMLSILESIHASDSLTRAALSTVLTINETLHATDTAPSVTVPTFLFITESLHLADGASPELIERKP